MVERKPIKIERVPIKLPTDIKMKLRLYEKQNETKDEDILEMIEHYNMLMAKATNKTGFTIVSMRNPKRSKQYIHFERVFEVCRMKGWDLKLYIEAQFDRTKGWTNMKYPLPSTLYSLNAFRHFTNYISTLKQTYEKDVGGHKKQKGSVTKSLRQQVIDGIVNTAEMLDMYVSKSSMEDKEQYKAMRIFQSWGEYSPFYLWSVPWFHDMIKELPDSKKVDEYKREFERISTSKNIQRLIEITVEQVEKHFNLPPNVKI